MNVLFIGNSFTFFYDVPSLFNSLCEKDGRSVDVESVTCGGWTLERHASVDDKCGKTVDEKLKSGKKYDVIILQEYSNRPIENYDSFLGGCKALAEKIRADNESARIILYETWGYGDEFEYLKEKAWKSEAMFERLEKAYADAAKEINAEVSHVGRGMVSLYRTTSIDPYDRDRKHQSYAGSYLAAVTHFLRVFPDAAKANVLFDGECTPEQKKAIVDIALNCR